MRFLLGGTGGPGSSNRKIFRAALTVGVLTVVVKLSATLKDLTVARLYGRSDALDAFLIAYVLPAFALNLIMGTIGSALIPVLVEVREKQGREAARSLFATTFLLSTTLLAIIAIVLGLLARFYLPWLGSGFSAEKLLLTRELLYLLLPSLLFGGMAAFASSTLNAGEKFALPALVPIITPVVTILFIRTMSNEWSAFALGTGVVAGSFLEAAFLLRALKANGMWPPFQWNGLNPAVRTILSQYLPMLAGSFLMGGTSIVDQSMAAILPGGSVAALNYANKVVSAVLMISGVALSTAALPYLAQMVARSDWDGCRHTLKRYSLLVLITSVPLTAILMLFSKPLIRILFQRGAFTGTDTELVSWVQVCYCFQIPFYMLNMLFVRFLSAVRRNDVLVYVSAINLVVDIVLNLVLMRVWGVAGIALSTSLVYIIAFSFLAPWSIKLLSQGASSGLAAVKVQEATQ